MKVNDQGEQSSLKIFLTCCPHGASIGRGDEEVVVWGRFKVGLGLGGLLGLSSSLNSGPELTELRETEDTDSLEDSSPSSSPANSAESSRLVECLGLDDVAALEEGGGTNSSRDVDVVSVVPAQRRGHPLGLSVVGIFQSLTSQGQSCDADWDTFSRWKRKVGCQGGSEEALIILLVVISRWSDIRLDASKSVGQVLQRAGQGATL